MQNPDKVSHLFNLYPVWRIYTRTHRRFKTPATYSPFTILLHRIVVLITRTFRDCHQMNVFEKLTWNFRESSSSQTSARWGIVWTKTPRPLPPLPHPLLTNTHQTNAEHRNIVCRWGPWLQLKHISRVILVWRIFNGTAIYSGMHLEPPYHSPNIRTHIVPHMRVWRKMECKCDLYVIKLNYVGEHRFSRT